MNKGKVCVSVCSETADEMIANVRRAEELADVVEVRFDCLRTDELITFRSEISNSKFKTPMLATYRSKGQGGHAAASLEERVEFWRKDGSGFLAADLEEDVFSASSGRKNRIISFHDFTGLPTELDAIFERLLATDADIVKIAFSAEDIVDTIPVMKLIARAKAAGKCVIPIAMDEAGKWTRILGLAHGAFLTYASLEEGSETAGGQITARDLIDVYRVKDLDRETKVFGVIGDPVSQSLSPYFQNPAFKAAGENAVFIPFLVKDLDEFIRRMVKPETREVDLKFGGFSVTMPHKQGIIKHLDAIDPTAETIGAVNTVKVEGGKLTGYNTDAHGFITPLKAKVGDLKNARVAVFGAGGAARACVYALKLEGANVQVFVREPARAASFANDLDVQIDQLPTANGKPPTGFDVVVNATPIGMKGALEGDSLFTSEQLLGVKFVFDLVTKPTDTPLIAAAKLAGIPAIGGIEMLIAQGAKQFEIWTGHAAPIDLMRDALLTRLNR